MIEVEQYLALLFLWWLIGAVSFLYWWTKEYDFKTGDIPTLMISGFIGPLGYILGWLIHGHRSDRIIIRRKRYDGEI